MKFLIVGLHHWNSRVKISASVQFSTFYFNYLWSYLLLTLFWSVGIATSLTGSNFEIFWYLGFITEFLVSKLVQVSNFKFYFNYLGSYLLLTPFWSRGIVTSLTGSNFEIFETSISSLHSSCEKLIQMPKFQLFISIICEVISFWPLFLSRGILTSLNGVKFWIFWYLGFITEFLVSKLVASVPISNFLFQLFVKLFAFDPFLVPGDCDVTNGVKFWIFWYLGFVTEFLLVSKLVQVSNFPLFISIIFEVISFWPFLWSRGICDVTNGVLKFLIVRLHHWIPRVKINASVQFQIFISIICEVIFFWPFFRPGGLWRH